MGTADIEAAINSIPRMKEDLRKSFEFLQSFSSSFSSFTLQWKDLEDHYSSIEKCIEQRFRELKELDKSSVAGRQAASTSALKIGKNQNKPKGVRTGQEFMTLSIEKEQNDKEVEPRPELKALCGNMDGEGLVSFITDNKKDIAEIMRELRASLLLSPDPANLILDSLVCFAPLDEINEGKLQSIRRTCASIMECVSGLTLEIKPEAKDRAMKMAVELKGMIRDGKGDNAVAVQVFLRLISTFGLAEFFEADDILNLITMLVKRQYILDLCRSPAFVERVPDLIEKLNNSGKQLDAIKFVLAFKLQAKYPPESLLKTYIKEAKDAAQEVRMKGNSSGQSKNIAIVKETDALKAVIRTVEEYNLESLYHCGSLHKRIDQLERQKMGYRPERKRGPAASNSNSMSMQPAPNKRPRPSDSFAPIFPTQPQHAHNPAQLGLIDRPPYAGMAGSYSMGSAAPSLYIHGNSTLPPEYAGVSGSRPTPGSYYPSESLAGSGYYDRAVVNGGYNTGLPAYNQSLYP